jgi:putative transposase
MQCFGQMRSLQKFVAVYSSVFKHFDQGRSLSKRDCFTHNRAAALAEWRGLCAA